MHIREFIDELDSAGFGSLIDFAKTSGVPYPTFRRFRDAVKQGRPLNFRWEVIRKIAHASGGKVTKIEEFNGK